MIYTDAEENEFDLLLAEAEGLAQSGKTEAEIDGIIRPKYSARAYDRYLQCCELIG